MSNFLDKQLSGLLLTILGAIMFIILDATERMKGIPLLWIDAGNIAALVLAGLLVVIGLLYASGIL